MFIRVYSGFVRLVPASVAYFTGHAIGALTYLFDVRHRRKTIENLERVFGRDMTAAERRRMARSVFRHMGYNVVEFCRIPLLGSDTFEKFVTVKGLDGARAALKRGKGVLFISAHLGNWELLGPLAALLDLSPSLVIRPIEMPEIDDIVEAYRQYHGVGIIEKKRAALPIMRRLARGECVGLLVDQRPHREAVVLDFMGHPASVTTVPAEIALRSGAAVIPAFAVRDRPGHIEMVFEKEIELARTGNLESDIVENTRRFQEAIERYVRRYPEQWLWPHSRWKPPKPRHMRGYYRNLQQTAVPSADPAVHSS